MERKKWKHTEETKRKMSETAKRIVNKGHFQKGHKIGIGNKYHLGFKNSLETKEKIRNTIQKKMKEGTFIPKTENFSKYRKEHGNWNKGKKGLQIAWNKGLTKEDERIKKTIKGWLEWRKTQITPIKDTSIEVKIQNFLKEMNIEFFTHQYIKEIEHGYQCDIFIPSKNLVIECDGTYWHNYPTGREIDNIRTKELLEKGFKVLRLWEFEINELNLNRFKQKINNI
jgi:very-short-patch-repair endonuclease